MKDGNILEKQMARINLRAGYTTVEDNPLTTVPKPCYHELGNLSNDH